ncbi:MAG TPA: glycosyltransferase family 4 protein [Cellvibrio sp.]|nr:glycosyltransferase family 4 protein [Cellvibrio sp.]
MIKFFIFCLFPLLTTLLICRVFITHFGNRLIDKPNDRSSHTIPTPRGGGIALATSSILTIFVAWQLGYLSSAPLLWLMLPAGLITILGIADDLFNLNIGTRLFVQTLLAAIGIFLIGIDRDLPVIMQGLLAALMVLFLVWMSNLYNFMDGINGLAALEAISACLCMGLIYWLQDKQSDSLHLMAIIAASSFGFLYWNFPKAKLFMGDAGSLFLGLSIGLITLENMGKDNNLLAAWLIMLGVFITDATYTLLYRMITKQPFHQAHRSHTYQKAAIRFKSHSITTFGVVLINIIWLFPLAFLTANGKLHLMAALLISYTPLFILAKKYRAGEMEHYVDKVL